jgi:tRNA G18 (ribose-2'-O)-methylase SpoU
MRQKRLAPHHTLPHLIFVLERIEKAANMAHALRLAHALDAEVIFVGTRPQGHESELTSFFKPWRTVKRRCFVTFRSAATYLAGRRAKIVAVDVSSRSVPYGDIRYQVKQPIALVVGSESRGIDEATLNSIQTHVHIPMRGSRSCLNAGMALSIVASHIAFVDAVRQRDGSDHAISSVRKLAA